MENGAAFVKGQKVISPKGEGFVVEITGETVKVRLESGDVETFDIQDLEDDSDAG